MFGAWWPGTSDHTRIWLIQLDNWRIWHEIPFHERLWLSAVPSLQHDISLTMFYAPMCCPLLHNTPCFHLNRINSIFEAFLLMVSVLVEQQSWPDRSLDLTPFIYVWGLMNKTADRPSRRPEHTLIFNIILFFSYNISQSVMRTDLAFNKLTFLSSK